MRKKNVADEARVVHTMRTRSGVVLPGVKKSWAPEGVRFGPAHARQSSSSLAITKAPPILLSGDSNSLFSPLSYSIE